jgi:hypothetical protein
MSPLATGENGPPQAEASARREARRDDVRVTKPERPSSAAIEEYHGAFAVRCHEGTLTADVRQVAGDLVWRFEDPPQSDFLVVNTGGQGGPFAVAMELHDSATPRPSAAWEEVAEVLVRCTGPLIASGLADPAPEAWLDCKPGCYRLRVSARGRDEGRRRDRECDWVDYPVEVYLIEAWPEESVAQVS